MLSTYSVAGLHGTIWYVWYMTCTSYITGSLVAPDPDIETDIAI